ncbi:MAG: rhomboid family intramembrane serine protease [Planctomycetales bacterium]
MPEPDSEIFRRLRRASPGWVTYALLQICILLFLFVQIESAEQSLPEGVAINHWGGLGGGFVLWQGDWWRLWATTLHHGSFLHLLTNMWALAYLGKLMERRLPSWQYVLFLLGAAGFSSVAQSFFNPHHVGLSGVICAIFGWLIARRDRDPLLAEQLPTDVIWITLGGLLAMIPLDAADILPIGNVAHFAGLIYGLAIEKLCRWEHLTFLRRTATISLLLITHALLIPAIWYASHPTWNALYYWSRADHSQNETQRRLYWKQALAIDPDLIEMYSNLAQSYAKSGEWTTAWKWALDGLQRRPADTKLIDLARVIGDYFIQTENLTRAQRILQDRFGNSSSAWELKLLDIPIPPAPTPIERLRALVADSASEGEST